MIDLTRKRITVTGGAGFLGRQIVAKLREQNCQSVFVPRSKDYDLRTLSEIERMLRDSRPDVIIHAAAYAGGIGLNQQRPAELFYDNAMMGIQLIHESYLAKVEKFVQIGTVCEYPKYTPVPFIEKDLWEGMPEETNSAYGLAKKMLLVQGIAYRRQYGFNSIHLLPVNMYGIFDHFDLGTSHVIPALIRKFIEAKQTNKLFVEVWGTGKVSREFLYVEDAADAVVKAAQFYDGADPINIGSGREISIYDLVTKIKSIVDFKGAVIFNSHLPDGQPRRCLDCSRAEAVFHFTANTTLDDGLQKTIAWYLAENTNG